MGEIPIRQLGLSSRSAAGGSKRRGEETKPSEPERAGNRQAEPITTASHLDSIFIPAGGFSDMDYHLHVRVRLGMYVRCLRFAAVSR